LFLEKETRLLQLVVDAVVDRLHRIASVEVPLIGRFESLLHGGVGGFERFIESHVGRERGLGYVRRVLKVFTHAFVARSEGVLSQLEAGEDAVGFVVLVLNVVRDNRRV
jgi:hypothetical protein